MGFLTGFFSIFNLFPETKSKTYDEIREDIDEKLSRLGIDLYHPSMYTTYDQHDRSFVPYSYYYQDLDRVSIYFKDEDYYVQTVNEDMELHISFETKEVVGLNFLNIKELAKKLTHDY